MWKLFSKKIGESFIKSNKLSDFVKFKHWEHCVFYGPEKRTRFSSCKIWREIKILFVLIITPGNRKYKEYIIDHQILPKIRHFQSLLEDCKTHFSPTAFRNDELRVITHQLPFFKEELIRKQIEISEKYILHQWKLYQNDSN